MHQRRKELLSLANKIERSAAIHIDKALSTHISHINTSNKQSTSTSAETWINASFYVLSGCCQPLILVLCKSAGIADPKCQLYMFFYALGPTLVIIPLVREGTKVWPSKNTIVKAAGICLWDIICTVTNYIGASLAGPTLFAIIYSSVTIWTAVLSQIFFQRKLQPGQWLAVVTVFGGLALTATDSIQLGEDVLLGLVLIVIGSAAHAMTYIMSEGIMTVSKETLTVQQNNAIQSGVAATTLLLWQLVYTLPRWEQKIGRPMHAAGTTYSQALGILLLFALSNLIHSSTFFYTLRYFPGGSTSAGVMKGLQAALVFVATHFAYCGRIGGDEMCFSKTKFVSLLTVSGGVMGYGVATSYYSSFGTENTKAQESREVPVAASLAIHIT